VLAVEKRVWWRGLAWVVVALALHWVGLRVQQSRLTLFAMIGLIWSIPAVVYGPALGRRLMFPCAYLLLAVPWHFLDTLTFPLRLMATTASGWILNGLGIPTTRIGTAMYSAAGGGFSVDVADPCSGLRSLLAIVALSTAYAYLSNRTTAQRWCLCLLSVPLVLLANMGRIVLTAILFMLFKDPETQHVIHDSSGYLVFILAVVFLLGMDALLVRAGQWRLREWKNSVTKHS
jgi:exosortase